MALKILSGPLKSRFAPIREGQKIGRAGCQLNIPDPKISQAHVIIEKKPDGELYLSDLGSANGIVVEGQKRRSARLDPGLIFQLGTTQLEVGYVSDDGKQFLQRLEDEIPPIPLSWNEYFANFCMEQKSVKNSPTDLFPLPYLVELEFLRGPLISKKYYVAYGPRNFGSESVDFSLYTKDLPEDVMTITSKKDEIYLKTRHTSLVKLNNKPMISSPIKDGDIVDISEHKIRISLKAAHD